MKICSRFCVSVETYATIYDEELFIKSLYVYGIEKKRLEKFIIVNNIKEKKIIYMKIQLMIDYLE